MSTSWGNYDVGELRGYSDDLDLVGLDKFKNKLEKHFFAQISIRRCITCSDTDIRLVIEAKGTIDFACSVKHFRTDVISDPGYNSRFLLKALAELQHLNTQPIDIEELAFTMSDTSIIVQRVGNLSVPRQYDNIMRIVMNDYKYIISQIREVPLEIHIPVLGYGDTTENNNEILSSINYQTSDKDYFAFWGLYFNSEEEAIIYDVENSDFIFEEVLAFLPQ